MSGRGGIYEGPNGEQLHGDGRPVGSTPTPSTRKWKIGYADREFAREMGDPVLGVVEATTKEEAERLAANIVHTCFNAALWAWEDK